MHPNKRFTIHHFKSPVKRRMYHTRYEKDNINIRNEDTNVLKNRSEIFYLPETSESNELPTILFHDKGIQVEVLDAVDEHKNLFHGSATFICTQYVRNDICEAQTQAYIPQKRSIVKKKFTSDKCCGPRVVQVAKAVGPDYPGSTDCITGFHGMSSITTDQQMLDIGGVTLSTFKMLLNELSDNKFKKITKENRLLIFLTKMKTGLSFSAISVMFQIHRITASRIFVAVLKSLRVSCDRFIEWPSREVVQSTMPQDFKQFYRDCRVIIDCIEIKIEQPSYVQNLVFTYSQCIRGSTAKILIGCTPAGSISFLSSCYGGRASDSQITCDSGILNFLEPGDVILADKEFSDIQTILEKNRKGTLIVIPPLRDSQLSDEVGVTSQDIRVRNHIKRIMRRLRPYKILNKLTLEIVPQADKIIFMCGVLANLAPPIPMLQCKATQSEESINTAM